MKFLITTEDERSWRTEDPIVFLGEWCRRFDRRHRWQPLDAVVCEPFCPTGVERDALMQRLATLAESLLNELADTLGRVHGERGGKRFWRLLLGHWIRRYVNVLHHRWQATQLALQDREIASTVALGDTSSNLAVGHTDAFTWACNDPWWNSVLIGRILLRTGNVAIEYRPECAAANPWLPATAAAGANPVGLLDRMAHALQRNSDALIINSYLPRAGAALLSLRLGQVPQRRRTPSPPNVAADPQLRRQHRQESLPGDFAQFAREMLFELLPTCYLEGFSQLGRQVDALGWPSRPRFVFTCNNFDTDESFKLWTARQIEDGRAYFTGQHGSNYGTARYCESEEECVATSDGFLTWGWEGPKCLPAFVFRTANRQLQLLPQGGLLLLELCLPHRLAAWDPYPEFQRYQEDQFEFARALPEDIRRELTVRLHAEHQRQPWGEPARWRERDPDVVLDAGVQPVAQLLARSRLVVHSYDSTGILEALSLDVPTLCFWSGGLAHLRDVARPAYQDLVEAGILHLSPLGAAQHVAAVWEDVEGWWRTPTVQAARMRFCQRYARTSPAPVRELAALLTGGEVR